MDFKKVTVGFFAAVMAMTSVCFADPETPVTTDVPATDPVPETTTSFTTVGVEVGVSGT